VAEGEGEDTVVPAWPALNRGGEPCRINPPVRPAFVDGDPRSVIAACAVPAACVGYLELSATSSSSCAAAGSTAASSRLLDESWSWAHGLLLLSESVLRL
jgi:hypothetical protein